MALPRLQPARRLRAIPLVWALWLVGLLLAPRPAQAQRDFTEPLVALDPGGHNAPVRSLVFTPDGSRLLSGGFDKVVMEWNLRDGRHNRTRVLRPPVWRGYAGSIYAMALSPPLADDAGQRLLAVGGFGVDTSRGNIAFFRYPGSPALPTGDIVAQLRSGTPGEPRPTGHLNTVMSLAFTPDGRNLISAGLDGQVLVWDVRTRSVLGAMPRQTRGVNAAALTPDGRTVITGGVDGYVRAFDLASRTLRQEAPPRGGVQRDAGELEITGVAVSPPNGRWTVIGRENGNLVRFETANLRSVLPLTTSNQRGAVEALAFSHDGRYLATSVVSRGLRTAADLAPVQCDIELRQISDGAVISKIATTDNFAYALAFSMDDSILAFGGGVSRGVPGAPARDSQGIVLKDLRNAARPLVELKGQGGSIWDIGFAPDSHTVGLARRKADRPNTLPEFEGYDFQTRQIQAVDPGQLVRARTSDPTWTIRPVDRYTIDLVNARGQGHRLTLDPALDRRWWSYTFIPGAAGHSRPAFAIGCEGGVVVWRLDTGQKTVYYAGHSGAVYAMAVSPDGRWLVTGSSDQTVRLWPLAGCDTLDTLGATFQNREDGKRVVSAVVANGFGARMGLKVGDLVERCSIGPQELPQDAFFARLDTVPPNTAIQMFVRRGDQVVGVNTTKRRPPALSLFPGLDGEWVAWMPEGYYETSASGDKRYLGWHRNSFWLDRPVPAPLAWFQWPMPTDFFAADRFEAELRRPAVLDALVRTGDLGQALAAVGPAPAPAAPARPPVALVAEDSPPIVRVVEPAARPADAPLAVAGGQLNVRTNVTAEDRSPIRSLQVLLDGRPIGQPTVFDPPQPSIDQQWQIPVPEGRFRVNVVATNAQGKERVEGFDVENATPPPNPARLLVLAAGTGVFDDAKVPAIRFADQDLSKVHAFLAKRGSDGSYQVDDSPTLIGPGARSEAIFAAIHDLDKAGLGPRDTAIVAIESHLLTCEKGRFLLGRDSAPGTPPRNAIPVEDLTDSLGRLADAGCRVILLIDGVHKTAPAAWSGRLSEWVRALAKRNVVTFVASNHGPSERGLASGAFFQGILDSTTARGRSRPWVDPKDRFTLDDFQHTVIQRVLEQTGRRQNAFCFVPETISRHAPFLDARATQVSPGTGEAAPAR